MVVSRCLSCHSNDIRWWGYLTRDGHIIRLCACSRHRGKLQAKCPQVNVVPIPKVKWL